jgi:hypothetical protein
MKLINRSLVISILFVMTGVGVTFAAGTNGTQNFLLGGNAGLTNEDVNQVLTLLVGPEGKPGAVGPAGADGVNGLDGAAGPAGADGRQGIDGAAGRDGASVATALLAVGDANCPTGGVSVTSTTGTAYICNGQQGAQGARGAQGAAGANGANGTNGVDGTNGTGGGGVGTGYGAGTLSAGTCDDSVDVQLKHTFAGGKFSLSQIVAANVKAACANATFKVTFTIRGTGALYGDGATANKYSARTPNDEITCSKVVAGANWTGTGDARQLTIEASDNCVVTRGTVSLALNELSARDINENVGFEIG